MAPIKIVELCQVSPSGGASRELLLPLLYFDIFWLRMNLLQSLFFYDLQCSESYFTGTIVPNLKKSLSETLKHFLPLSGKIVFPLTSGLPVSHYVAGEDSVSLTIAQSDGGLTGNNLRNAGEFHDFVPQMPAASYSPDLIKFSVFAVQLTLFPNQGISIGITNHHAVCDGANMFDFMHKWASINKLNGDTHLAKSILPCYDRSVTELTELFWKQRKTIMPVVSVAVSVPAAGKLRGTFVLSEVEMTKLKSFVINKKPATDRVSSFTVLCGHVWSCLAKSGAGEVPDEEEEHLLFMADYKARLNPPLPHTYFGNCLIPVKANISHGRLTGDEGFVAAVEAIGEAIGEAFDKGLQVQEGPPKWMFGERDVRVAGTPRIDPYGVDYGWGRPKKHECIHIDNDGAVFFSKSREGGVEIGLALPRPKMDSFAAIFEKTKNIINNF